MATAGVMKIFRAAALMVTLVLQDQQPQLLRRLVQ